MKKPQELNKKFMLIESLGQNRIKLNMVRTYDAQAMHIFYYSIYSQTNTVKTVLESLNTCTMMTLITTLSGKRTGGLK